MQRFYADRFIRMIRVMDLLKSIQERSDPVSLDEEAGKPLRAELLRNTKILCKMLLDMDLQMSLRSAEKLEASLERSAHLGQEFCDVIDDINTRIEDEMGLSLCFIINRQNAELYIQKEPVFGHIVSNKFPGLATDISEVGKCYAVGRFTACVFHLMRIMEHGVQELGRVITGNPTITDKEWQKIINDTRGGLTRKYPNAKDQNRIKYESVLAHLETVKIAWRNPTMHPKETYTEEEAEGVLSAVKTFMRELVKII